MRLDHVAYATTPAGLLDVVQRLGARLGASFADGGRHPRSGTRNFVLPMAGGTYLEVVAVLDHPAADAAPFGQAVRRRAEVGGGWLSWVVAVDDLAPVERRLGRAAVASSRTRPDGTTLSWRQLGVHALLEDASLPFFLAWDVPAAEHPSAGADSRLAVEAIELAGDERVVDDWLGGPVGDVLGEVAIEWLPSEAGPPGRRDGPGQPGIVAVRVATPHGSVRID